MDKTLREEVSVFFIQHKRLILLIFAILILTLSILVIVKINHKDILGNYTTVVWKGDGIETKLSNSFFCVNGVDSRDKMSELYIRLGDMSGHLEGYVNKLFSGKDYEKYKFSIAKQTGTVFGEMDYIYFYHYPNRGSNGMIEITGSGITIQFFR